MAVALAAGGLAFVGMFLLPGKWTIIVAGLLGSGLGLLLEEVKAPSGGAFLECAEGGGKALGQRLGSIAGFVPGFASRLLIPG